VAIGAGAPIVLYAALGAPGWSDRAVAEAGGLYAVVALAMAVLAATVWRDLDRFQALARETCRVRRPGLEAASRVPELMGLARELDGLAAELARTSEAVRRAAEDNAHAYKAPLATIQASLDRLRRTVPAGDERGQRAATLIGLGVERLCQLINAGQILDYGEARLIAAPRTEFDLARLVSELMRKRGEHGLGGGTRLIRSLADNVVIRANRELMAEAIDAVLDNALRHSGPESTVSVTLAAGSSRAELRIEDEGPGLDEEMQHRVFHRFLAMPQHPVAPDAADEGSARGPNLAGLGLWTAKRTLESAGGSIALENRPSGGLAVGITLPRAG
jgi:two-component system sensor histidine kinase ChvG